MTLPNKTLHVFSQVWSTAMGTYKHRGQTLLRCSHSKAHKNSVLQEGESRPKIFQSPVEMWGTVKPLLPINTLVSLHLDCLRDFSGDSLSVARAYAHTGALLEASGCCLLRQHNSSTYSGKCKLLLGFCINHLWASPSRTFPTKPA